MKLFVLFHDWFFKSYIKAVVSFENWWGTSERRRNATCLKTSLSENVFPVLYFLKNTISVFETKPGDLKLIKFFPFFQTFWEAVVARKIGRKTERHGPVNKKGKKCMLHVLNLKRNHAMWVVVFKDMKFLAVGIWPRLSKICFPWVVNSYNWTKIFHRISNALCLTSIVSFCFICGLLPQICLFPLILYRANHCIIVKIMVLCCAMAFMCYQSTDKPAVGFVSLILTSKIRLNRLKTTSFFTRSF